MGWNNLIPREPLFFTFFITLNIVYAMNMKVLSIKDVYFYSCPFVYMIDIETRAYYSMNKEKPCNRIVE
jgi:hypothetical protein